MHCTDTDTDTEDGRHHKLEVAHQQLLLGLAMRVPADGDGDDPRLLGRVLVVAGVLRPGVRLTVRACNTTQLTTATSASNEGLRKFHNHGGPFPG